MKHIFPAILAITLIFGTLSCSPKITENVRTEYRYRDREVHDSTFVHDSVFIREVVRGDTVRITEYRDRVFWRDRFRTDTLISEVHDTTLVAVEVQKKLSPVQRMKQDSFWWLVFAVAALLLWTFRKRLIKFI